MLVVRAFSVYKAMFRRPVVTALPPRLTPSKADDPEASRDRDDGLRARPSRLGDLCVAEALSIIEKDGLEALSLREVARRLGVSHQAPYKHFPSRDHLIAEVLRRCFANLTAALRARDASEDPDEDLRRLGQAYLGHALARPLEYRLMFGTPWPGVGAHPDVARDSRFAFDVLREVLSRRQAAHGDTPDPAALDQDAMFVWSAMHGLAGILQSDAMGHLGLDAQACEAVPAYVMAMVDRALEAARR
jgi:AcrR family transcriptional regulator